MSSAVPGFLLEGFSSLFFSRAADASVSFPCVCHLLCVTKSELTHLLLEELQESHFSAVGKRNSGTVILKLRLVIIVFEGLLEWDESILHIRTE